MTFHFYDLDKPAALEDDAAVKSLEELTGCPVHKKIDAVCSEPGCPNNPQTKPGLSLTSSAIFETRPRVRCIL